MIFDDKENNNLTVENMSGKSTCMETDNSYNNHEHIWFICSITIQKLTLWTKYLVGASSDDHCLLWKGQSTFYVGDE